MSDDALRLVREAVALLAASATHFKSRQVAEARRKLEQALTRLEMEHGKKTESGRHSPTQKN